MSNQRDNSGSVFRNERKRPDKQDADFNGSVVVGGVEYWMDMWTNPPKDGKKGFFGVKFRQKEARGQQQTQQRLPARPQQAARRPGLPPPPSGPDPDAGIDENSPDIAF